MHAMTKTGPRKMSLARHEARFGWILIMPAVVIIGSLIIYPILYNVYLSFFDVKLVGDNVYLGFANYVNVLKDGTFWKSVYTTLLYVVCTVTGTTLMGLFVALVMNREFPLRGLVRSLVLLPYVAPVISVVFSWQFMFDPVHGIFVEVLVEKLHLVRERFNLIGSPQTAVWVAILFSIWKNFPFTYLMILSRMQAIDRNLYEAADIDGCNAWRKLLFITLPEIYFVMSAIVLLRIIWNFFKFEEIYLLTENVKVLSIYTYFKAFTGAMDMGQGAALALIQFLLLVMFILVYVKKVLKW